MVCLCTYKHPNFEKRRVTLRDTVEKLSTEEKRNHCRKKAAENHQHWGAARATEQWRPFRNCDFDKRRVTDHLNCIHH